MNFIARLEKTDRNLNAEVVRQPLRAGIGSKVLVEAKIEMTSACFANPPEAIVWIEGEVVKIEDRDVLVRHGDREVWYDYDGLIDAGPEKPLIEFADEETKQNWEDQGE